MNRDEMYETSPRSVALDRGMSLHKMIRLITHALAGDSYMNFVGIYTTLYDKIIENIIKFFTRQ